MSEEIIMRIKYLINELGDLQQQIDEINQKIELIYNEGNINGLKRKKLYCYQFQEFNLCEKLNQLDLELRFLKPASKSNGVIELRKHYNKMVYSICLCGEKTEIGSIQYRGYHDSKIYGDIGYVIHKKYRGNNYAYQSLCLLSELLNEMGINDFLISAETSNIASNKTIQKYGGILIDNVNGVCVYDCETRINHKDLLDKNLIK